jgi:DNA mismatch repair protein MutS
MKYEKEVTYKDYFKIHEFYTKIYGDNTIILMQVGSFHECYGTDEKGLDLVKISEQLDVIHTKRNTTKPLSDSNPRMVGFPVYVIDNFIDKLVKLNYTVVVIDQTSPPPAPKREVTGIYSPSTYINSNENTNNNLVSIIIDEASNNNYYIGVCSYDLITGYGCFYETTSKSNDNMLALDEIVRFLEKYPPKEVIFQINSNLDKKVNDLSLDDIKVYLGINNLKIYNIHNLSVIKKVSFQQQFINDIFNHKSSIDCLTDLNLVYYNLARLALVSILDFAKNHQSSLLNKLQKPIYFENNTFLFLGNRAIEQLDVITDKNLNLFKIINFTKTQMGKRLLRENLCNPILDIKELNNRYDLIENICEKELEKVISSNLNNIYDIEKLNRKIDMKKINPNEFYNFYFSYKKFYELLNLLEDNNLIDYIENNNDTYNKNKKNLKKFIEYFEKSYNYEQLMVTNFINYKEESISFFNKDIHKEIDDIADKINVWENFMDYLVEELSNHIDDKMIFKKNNNSLITIKYNERAGHYFILTKRRCNLLRKNLEKLKTINIKNLAKIDVKDLEFEDLPRSSNTKINCAKLKQLSTDVVKYRIELANKLKEVFYEEMEKVSSKYSKYFNYWSKKIAYLDFLNSGAICSKNHGYFRPSLVESDKSFFTAKDIRHPIVEIINTDYEYNPHNISLGKDINGILLYGINSSGKSTLMKSIGMNIILAQIGYYVAAKELELAPYRSLFTRICGNDNIFRGLSSFMVEMVELMSILKRNNKNTLVIGDEICRGTEEKSANVMVAYMLEKLDSNDCNFITATHLHQIANLPSVKYLEKVKPMHLKVDYDAENDRLIFNRVLEDGPGENFYGVQVAKFLMKDDHFNKRIKELENEFDDVKVKTSNYNKDNWMLKCYFCESTKKLESHHINWQKDCDDKVVLSKPHIKKNTNNNLLTVCMKCHDMIDTDEIVVKGWKNSTDGILLDYFKQEKKKKTSKFSLDEIELINSYKNKDVKQAKTILLAKHNIKLSQPSIKKIWNNNNN